MNEETDEKHVEALKRLYAMPELGITFHRAASPRCVRLAAFFRSVPMRRRPVEVRVISVIGVQGLPAPCAAQEPQEYC